MPPSRGNDSGGSEGRSKSETSRRRKFSLLRRGKVNKRTRVKTRTGARTQLAMTTSWMTKRLAEMMIGMTKRKLARVKRKARTMCPLRAKLNQHLSHNGRPKKPKSGDIGRGRGG